MPNNHMTPGLMRLKADLFEGRVGRREFLRGATALGLSLTAANSWMSQAQAASPQKGGTLKAGLAHGSTTDSLDPATYENGFTIAMDYSLFNHLTEVDVDGQLIPELAESWEASDDASQWTFKLRKGVEFHNGKTLTADDVVASINHHRGEDTKSAAAKIVAPITDVKSDGADTVVFKLESGNADFPFIVSDYHLAICPGQGRQGIDWQSGIGTGGYKPEEPSSRVCALRRASAIPTTGRKAMAHFDEASS